MEGEDLPDIYGSDIDSDNDAILSANLAEPGRHAVATALSSVPSGVSRRRRLKTLKKERIAERKRAGLMTAHEFNWAEVDVECKVKCSLEELALKTRWFPLDTSGVQVLDDEEVCVYVCTKCFTPYETDPMCGTVTIRIARIDAV